MKASAYSLRRYPRICIKISFSVRPSVGQEDENQVHTFFYLIAGGYTWINHSFFSIRVTQRLEYDIQVLKKISQELLQAGACTSIMTANDIFLLAASDATTTCSILISPNRQD